MFNVNLCDLDVNKGFVAHEAAVHNAQLRVELSQSRKEQREYLKNVELSRVLDKRAEKKGLKVEELRKRKGDGRDEPRPKKKQRGGSPSGEMDSVLTSVF